jgi:hypothetical protein
VGERDYTILNAGKELLLLGSSGLAVVKPPNPDTSTGNTNDPIVKEGNAAYVGERYALDARVGCLRS